MKTGPVNRQAPFDANQLYIIRRSLAPSKSVLGSQYVVEGRQARTSAPRLKAGCIE
jgi:hypothetical protein